MATKMFSCFLVVFVLLAVFSPESDAFANGAGQGLPGKKRSFQKMNSLPEEMDCSAIKRHLCVTAERLGC
ncbi:hypothetical protein ACROYT_G019014 [Oculina patagonica]